MKLVQYPSALLFKVVFTTVLSPHVRSHTYYPMILGRVLMSMVLRTYYLTHYSIVISWWEGQPPRVGVNGRTILNPIKVRFDPVKVLFDPIKIRFDPVNV